jgi:hypothetical protein
MEVMKESRRRQPLLLLAAWISPAIPVATAVATIQWTNSLPSGSRADTLGFGFAMLACLIGLLSALTGLFGVKANGAWATVPVALLGLLLNAGVGLLAFVFWGLSQGSRC